MKLRARGEAPLSSFDHDRLTLAYADWQADAAPGAEPVLLIHGFASSMQYNWIAPGWIETLLEAGYRPIALDNRGHGGSTKSYDPADYSPDRMAGDAAALLARLSLRQAHVMGYSMGARVSAFLALSDPKLVATLVLGGLGIGLVDGVGDWDPIAEALLEPDRDAITHARGRAFRAFAEQTRSDRKALAACISTSRVLLARDEVARIGQPALVAVGTKDDIAGSPQELAALMPHAQAFDIAGRDHMLAVGDRSFKAAVVAFLRAHPIGSGQD